MSIHVYPIDDLIEHELTEDCPCGVAPELERTTEDGDRWVIVHSSLDGRELRE